MFSIQYRSKTFNEVFGHKIIIDEMKKRSKDKNFPEVIILEGNSGCGKTTVGFIIAKLLNCKNPIIQDDGHYEPCNECESCKDINFEKFNRDVSFFDASNMSKDDVLKLEENVSNFPFYDTNKIIILDEAQELSKQGKGATLKLLEKKRKNVHFILCTMDKEALSDAIKRRGQVYLFKPVDKMDIAEYLAFILKKENLFNTINEEFLTEGIFLIAESSNGSPGVAISLLERCIMSELYTKDKIIVELGLVSNDISTNLLEKILKKDTEVFEDLKKIDLKEFFMKSFKIMNDALIWKISGFTDQEWKEKGAKRLTQNVDNLKCLLEVFNKIKVDPYFKESSFWFELTKYFDNNESFTYNNKINEQKRVPVR
jgi:DNA polymerase-3 subunit gamma/tau